jgi:hypothetical protein
MSDSRGNLVTKARCSFPVAALVLLTATVAIFQLEGRWSALARDHLACLKSKSSSTFSRGSLPAIEFGSLTKIYMPETESKAIIEQLEKLALRTEGRLAYLEYGSGGSTTVFTKFANVAVSVEHDAQWCAGVGKQLKEARMKHVIQLCVPKQSEIQPTAGWDGDYEQYRNYIDAVDRPGLPLKYDFVYVDGRARVAAALKVLPYLRNDSIVVLHDAVREIYSPVEKYYKVQTFVESGNKHRNGFKIMMRREDIDRSLPLTEDDIEDVYDEVRSMMKLPKRKRSSTVKSQPKVTGEGTAKNASE